MSCEETLALIHGYLDGELDVVQSMQIGQHLQECSRCERVYKNNQALQSAIKSSSLYYQAPEHLAGRIRTALGQTEEAKAKSAAPKIPWQVRWRPAWGLMGIAASMALLAVIIVRLGPWAFTHSQEDLLAQEVLASHVRSLMASHLTDVPSTDQHTVKPWFNGKLDFSPPVQDLSSQGYPLVGGRLDYLEDRPVAALVYQRRKHFINLFIWPAAQDSEQKTIARHGYTILHWTRGGMTYWAVSDLNSSELNEFAQLLQRGP
jgi:mycothiol system anti-sigma-R factor